ncbi:hypothetical protein SSTU70S_04700 [Stutzerimonas stutzeri]
MTGRGVGKRGDAKQAEQSAAKQGGADASDHLAVSRSFSHQVRSPSV